MVSISNTNLSYVINIHSGVEKVAWGYKHWLLFQGTKFPFLAHTTFSNYNFQGNLLALAGSGHAYTAAVKYPYT